MPVIKSESKNRLAKGSKCQFVVQYVGECGKACQEQGKATLTIDSTNQTTLFFSISFWVSSVFECLKVDVKFQKKVSSLFQKSSKHCLISVKRKVYNI